MTWAGMIYLTELLHCTRNAAHLFIPFFGLVSEKLQEDKIIQLFTCEVKASAL